MSPRAPEADEDLDPTDVLPRSSRLRESADDDRADALVTRTKEAAEARKHTQPMLGRAAEREREDAAASSKRPTVRGLGTLGSDELPDEVETRDRTTQVKKGRHGTELLGKGPVASAAPTADSRRAPSEAATRPDALPDAPTKKMPRTRDVKGVPVLVPQTLRELEAPKPPPDPKDTGAREVGKGKQRLFTAKLEARHADEPEVGIEAMERAALRSDEATKLRRLNVLLVAVVSALVAIVVVMLALRWHEARQREAAPTAPPAPTAQPAPPSPAAPPSTATAQRPAPATASPPAATAAPSESAPVRAPVRSAPREPQRRGPLTTD